MGIRDLFRPRAAVATGTDLVEIEQTGQIIEGEAFVLDFSDPRLADLLRGGRETEAGQRVTVASAMKIPTVLRCVSIISDTMGMLPLHLIDKQTKEKAVDHPLYRVLHRNPNGIQTANDFKKLMEMRVQTKGNAYARVVRSRDIRSGQSKVIALVPMDPDRVTAKEVLGELRYEYRRPDGGTDVLQAADVLHLRDLSEDGITGTARVYYAGEAIGLAQAASQALGRLFRNGSFINGYLAHPKSLSKPARDRLRQDWDGRFSGSENAGKTPVFEEGLDYKTIGPNAKDAQSQETRAFQIEEIARVFGVPRPFLMMDDTSWGSGIDVLGQFFLRNCLSPRMESWQQAIERVCLTEAEQDRYEVKFNPGALLRGSMADQGDYFSKALGAGGHQPWMTPNEVRQTLDMPDHEDGDKLENPMTAQKAAQPAGDPASAGATANG